MASRMRRFYKQASVAEDERRSAVLLDGRQVRTPGGGALALPTPALAAAIAEEWEAQGENLDPRSMLLTQLASTALDRILPDPSPVAVELSRFAETDLLCYRAELPVELATRQAEGWQPLLEWFETRYDARFVVTRGVMPVAQPRESVERVAAALRAFDGWSLAALGIAIPAAGSAVLGLAMAESRIDAASAFELSQQDESYQLALWGEDPDAARRRTALRRDLDAAGRFLELCRA
ncbi:MAG: ATP12 family protein [Acetobacterales bacterium]